MAQIQGIDSVLADLGKAEQKYAVAGTEDVAQDVVKELLAASRGRIQKAGREVAKSAIGMGWPRANNGRLVGKPRNVEFRQSGKYIHLWPGIGDMKTEIARIITDEIKGVL